MGDQLAEMKTHLCACIAQADLAIVPGALQRQVHAALLPGAAELIERHRYWAESRGRFAVYQAGAPGCLLRRHMPQRHFIGQHHQAYAFQGLLRCTAHGQVGADHRHLGVKVDAGVFAGQHHVITRAAKVLAAALVHQRRLIRCCGQLSTTGAQEQFGMAHEGSTLDPLVGAWQRRHAARRLKGKGVAGTALVQRVIQVLQLR